MWKPRWHPQLLLCYPSKTQSSCAISRCQIWLGRGQFKSTNTSAHYQQSATFVFFIQFRWNIWSHAQIYIDSRWNPHELLLIWGLFPILFHPHVGMSQNWTPQRIQDGWKSVQCTPPSENEPCHRWFRHQLLVDISTKPRKTAVWIHKLTINKTPTTQMNWLVVCFAMWNIWISQHLNHHPSSSIEHSSYLNKTVFHISQSSQWLENNNNKWTKTYKHHNSTETTSGYFGMLFGPKKHHNSSNQNETRDSLRSIRPLRSGMGTTICRSKRPGRVKAWSFGLALLKRWQPLDDFLMFFLFWMISFGCQFFWKREKTQVDDFGSVEQKAKKLPLLRMIERFAIFEGQFL